MIFLFQIQNAWYVIVISAEVNIILIMNKLFSAFNKIITSSKSQNVWYIIMISAEANMILAMNESSSTCNKITHYNKTLTSSETSSAWYVIIISTKANMMLIIKNLLKKVQIHYHDLYYIC